MQTACGVEPHRDLRALDAVDPAKAIRDLRRFIALDRSDEMPLGRSAYLRDFFNGFLNVALAESRLARFNGVFDI